MLLLECVFRRPGKLGDPASKEPQLKLVCWLRPLLKLASFISRILIAKQLKPKVGDSQVMCERSVIPSVRKSSSKGEAGAPGEGRRVSVNSPRSRCALPPLECYILMPPYRLLMKPRCNPLKPRDICPCVTLPSFFSLHIRVYLHPPL